MKNDCKAADVSGFLQNRRVSMGKWLVYVTLL
jgi:hypothetical protein